MELCAYRNTVVGSIASGSYVPNIHALASSVAPHGFACLVTQPYDMAHKQSLRHRRIHLLPPPLLPLLPRQEWCSNGMYGWRRVHLHKVLMMRRVLHAGLDLLQLDANYVMLYNPMPLILDIPTQRGGVWSRDTSPDVPMDFVAVSDGPANKLLNIGLMWIRSTNATCKLAARVENRTWGAWDQYVVADELHAAVGVGCCHTNCILLSLSSQYPESYDTAAKTLRGAAARQKQEGTDICAEPGDAPRSLPPPAGSRLFSRWNGSAYNLSPKLNHRKSWRCVHSGAACVGAANNNCTGFGWRAVNASEKEAVIASASARFDGKGSHTSAALPDPE